MSKSSGLIIGFPLVLLALIMQVYSLWGWLARDGWIQYFLMAEVYLLIFISFLYLRSIYRLKNIFISATSLLLIPSFYFVFSQQESTLGSMSNSLWYINILISVIGMAWFIVLSSGSFFLIRELLRQKLEGKMLIVCTLLLALSALLTYFIIKGQIPDSVMAQIWKVDKLRTLWYVFEPILVLSFSLISIYLYLGSKSFQEMKKAYTLIGLFIVFIGFEYMINGLGLVSLRSVLYFLGFYSFIKLIKNQDLVNYFLISIFIILVFVHLNYYSIAPDFMSWKVFIPFLHNALIESIKLFLVIYIFIRGWSSVQIYKTEFRLLMILIPLIAYTYTTQSQGNGVHFYDIIAITAMLKSTAAFMIILYSFYYFRDNTKITSIN